MTLFKKPAPELPKVVGPTQKQIDAHLATVAAKAANAPKFVAPEMQKTKVDRVSLDRSGIEQGFDLARRKAEQTEGRALQGQKDAMARRAAQLGGGPGGALLKLEQQASNASAERLGSVGSELEAAKAAELRKLSDAETQLNLQREEAQAARDLAKWQTDTNTAMQKFGMDVDQGRFEETLALQKRASDLAYKAQAFQESMAGKQLDFAWKQFEHEKYVDDFNMKLATKMANEKDPLEQLFGNFSMSNISSNAAPILGIATGTPLAAPQVIRGL